MCYWGFHLWLSRWCQPCWGRWFCLHRMVPWWWRILPSWRHRIHHRRRGWCSWVQGRVVIFWVCTLWLGIHTRWGYCSWVCWFWTICDRRVSCWLRYWRWIRYRLPPMLNISGYYSSLWMSISAYGGWLPLSGLMISELGSLRASW